MDIGELTGGGPEMQGFLLLLCGVAMVIGIIGVIVPVLPGLGLCWAAVLGWAVFSDAGWGRWVVLALCTVWVVAGSIVKYTWPGQRLKESGVPTRTLIAGVLLGLVGMFVIPFVGLLVGFVAGVWAVEAQRLGGFRQAWPSTKEALLGTGLSILIELVAAVLVVGTWVIGILVT